jgi:hypothetical protein
LGAPSCGDYGDLQHTKSLRGALSIAAQADDLAHHKKLHHDKTKTRWWYTYPPEKYEFVSWGYEIPNIWKFIKHD